MIRLGEVTRCAPLLRASLLALGVALGNGACTTNHDALARQPKAGSSAGGSAGSGGSIGTGNTGNQAQGGRPNPDYEPPRDSVLTIVNGVVDAPRVRLCFARLGEDGEAMELQGAPSPDLPYAASTVQTELEGFSFQNDVIVPWVIAGDLSLVDDLDCAQAVELAQAEEASVTPDEPFGIGEGGSGGQAEEALPMPALRARAVSALPAGTASIGRSLLLVLSGCIGGAAYRDAVETAVCGDDYTPYAPTLQPLLVTLSRDVRFDKIGLQAVHASPPTSSLDVRVSGDSNAVALVFASSVSYGSIEPRPADTRFSPVELGVTQSSYGLQAVGEQGDVVFQRAWTDVLAASGIAALLPARSYTTVFVGPTPRLSKEGWWNEPAFALVDNDPTRQ